MFQKKALFLSLVAFLASCSGGPSSTEASKASDLSSSAGDNSSSAATSAAPSGPVAVEFWHTFGQKTIDAIEKAATDFEKIIKEREGVDVSINLSYQGGYDDIRTKIVDGFSTGNVPSMAIAYPDHVADYLVGDYVYDLSSYAEDKNLGFGKQADLKDTAGIDDFVESFYEEGTHYEKKGMYSLPLMKSSEVMFYNKPAVLKAMRYYNPDINSNDAVARLLSTMSWDELLRLAQVIKDHASEISTSLKRPIWYDSDSNLFISKMYQNKIPFASITDEGKGTLDFDTGEAKTQTVAMLQGLKDAYQAGLLTTKKIENGAYGSDAFKKQESIFEIGSSGGTGYNDPEGGAFDVGVARVPASNNNPLYVSQGPTLTFLKNPKRTTEENDLRMRYAWQFAKYLTNPDTNVYLCIYGSEGYLPVRYSAYDTREFAAFLSEDDIYSRSANVLIKDINGAYLITPVFKGSATLRDEVGGLMPPALKGEGELDALVAKAAENVRKKM